MKSKKYNIILGVEDNSTSAVVTTTVEPTIEPTTEPQKIYRLLTRLDAINYIANNLYDYYKIVNPNNYVSQLSFIAAYMTYFKNHYDEMKDLDTLLMPNDEDWLKQTFTIKSFKDEFTEDAYKLSDDTYSVLVNNFYKLITFKALDDFYSGNVVVQKLIQDSSKYDDSSTSGEIVDPYVKNFLQKFGFKYIINFDTSFGNNKNFLDGAFTLNPNNTMDVFSILSRDLPIINININQPNIFRHLINIYGVNTDVYKIDANHSNTDLWSQIKNLWTTNNNSNNEYITIPNDIVENFTITNNTLHYNDCFVVKKDSNDASVACGYGGLDILWNEYPGTNTAYKDINKDLYNFNFSTDDLLKNDYNPYSSSTLYEVWSDKMKITKNYSDIGYNELIKNSESFVKLPKSIEDFLMYLTPELGDNPQITSTNRYGKEYQGFGKVYTKDSSCYVENALGNYVYMKSNDNQQLVPCDLSEDGDYYYLTLSELNELRKNYTFKTYSINEEKALDFDGYLVTKNKDDLGIGGTVYAWDSDMPKFKMFYIKYLNPTGADLTPNPNEDNQIVFNDINRWYFLPNFTSKGAGTTDENWDGSTYIFNHDYELMSSTQSGTSTPTQQNIRFLKTNANSNVYINQYMNFSRGYFFIDGNIAQMEQKSILQFPNKENDEWVDETDYINLFIETSQIPTSHPEYINNVILKFRDDKYYLQGDLRYDSAGKKIDEKDYYVYRLFYKFEVADVDVDASTGVPTLDNIWINGFNFLVYTNKEDKTTTKVDLKDYIKTTKLGDYYGYLLDSDKFIDKGCFYNLLGFGTPYACVQSIVEADKNDEGYKDIRYVYFNSDYVNQIDTNNENNLTKLKNVQDTLDKVISAYWSNYQYPESEKPTINLDDKLISNIINAMAKNPNNLDEVIKNNFGETIYNIVKDIEIGATENSIENDLCDKNYGSNSYAWGWDDFFKEILTLSTNPTVKTYYHYISIADDTSSNNDNSGANGNLTYFQNFSNNPYDAIYSTKLSAITSVTSDTTIKNVKPTEQAPGCWSCHYTLPWDSENKQIKNLYDINNEQIIFPYENYTSQKYTLTIIDGIVYNTVKYGNCGDSSIGEDGTSPADLQ